MLPLQTLYFRATKARVALRMRSLLLTSFLVLFGCSKLTEPGKEDPITGDMPTEAKQADNKPSAAPTGMGSAKPLHEAAAAAAAGDVVASKVEIKEVSPGKGPEAKEGDTVSVHYTGKLTDGKEFDSSKKSGKPLDFVIGQHRVIKGWEQGITGMKAGQKRTLTIPPDLAYGPRGYPPVIPANATLVFDVELVKIEPKK